jgi:hypothetical protein
MTHIITSISAILLLASFCTAGWIDPDTPEDKTTTNSLLDNKLYNLVMSDEVSKAI